MRRSHRWLLLSLPRLLSVALLCAGCDELMLRRTVAGASADTALDPVDPLSSSGRHRVKEVGPRSAVAAEAHFARIRRTLRRLVAAEEAFFAENGAYSEDLSLIGFKPEESTESRFLWLSREGWAASGTHPALEGMDCVIFVGKADAPPTTLKYVRHGREGVPVCDDSRPPRGPAAAPPPPVARDTGSALDVLSPTVAMKVDLRNLMRSQETYFAMQGVYARRTEPLALQYLWHKDVAVRILSADAQSWSARATHSRSPGKSCVIWFGSVSQRPMTDHVGHQADRSGVPVCDE